MILLIAQEGLWAVEVSRPQFGDLDQAGRTMLVKGERRLAAGPPDH